MMSSQSGALSAITREAIAATEKIIAPHIRKTPIFEIAGEELKAPGARIILKLECFQYAGSFKTRGAFANLKLRAIPPVGVAAASGGNHGVAVAYAAMKLGLPARIFVPRISSPAKIQRIREFGADLVIDGNSYAEALQACETWLTETGALSIHAFDANETLLGQGTLGKELQEQAPNLNCVLAPVGGGGLVGGIASWYQGDARVIGIEPEKSPTMTKAWTAGEPVDAEAGGIAADSLAPRRVGALVFPIAKRYLSAVLLVSDDDIRLTQQLLWNSLRIVAEPGGVAALAAIVAGKYKPEQGERVGVVVSGANTVAVNYDLQQTT